MSQNEKEATLQITGMTCAACALRIEKGLKKVKGVQEANVNLALEKSTIKYDSTVTNVRDLQKKVEDLGYGVVKEKKDFTIAGMTCAACSARIEKGLNKLDGVSNAMVNLALETATVELNPSEVSYQDIIARVEKLGYSARLKEEQSEDQVDHRQAELEKQTGKFLFSIILS
jgi:Cu+-exporting ATPase